ESKPRKDNKTKQEVAPIRVEERDEIDPKTQKKRTKKLYIYPKFEPRGDVILDFDPTRDGHKGLWTKLWRDSLWGILRGVPAQRAPFNDRANREPTDDAQKAYELLASGADEGVPLPSTFFLGAMDRSAEDVAF